ncbi:MAG: Asp-tRNA(Asn)/Glu-tRNA(Gln) amidotransferase subunit GatC [Bacteroidetes bacterium]|nr:Asp-tRNA(Asn)/Glu-tRNA(Gln) amidotransferase subunit GatC [Bacteroidota bacterium]
MEVNEALVEKLSRLSALSFTKEEKMHIQDDLQKMILFVEKLNELNTDGVEPQLHITDAENVFRDDIAGKMISNEAALENAPNPMPPYFTATKAIQKPVPEN